jgi:ABC-2 type transport system permease protein
MSATSLHVSELATDSTLAIPARRLLRAYFVEAKYEFVRMLRVPGFSIPFLGLPVGFLLLFGALIFGGAVRSDPNLGKFFFTGFAVLGVMGPGMFGFGMAVAVEREQGLLKLKRALPMPPAAYLLAKMFMSMLFGVIIMASLVLATLTFVHLNLHFSQIVSAVVICILGALPFCALGLLLGVLCTARSAGAIVNVVYQVMMHLSGLFYPLPKFMQTMAPIWPTYHLQHLVMNALGAPSRGSILTHIAVLVGLTLIFTVLAVRRLVRVG